MLRENFEMVRSCIGKKTLSEFLSNSVLCASRYNSKVIKNRLVPDNLNYVRGVSSKRNVTKF